MIHLKKGNAEAIINPLGAEMIAYKDASGEERLHDADPAVWAGVGPILFPILCTPKDGQVLINSQSYPMPKHGFARNSEFEITNQTEDAVELMLCENEETLKSYPFIFEFTVRHSLTEKGFKTEMIVKNSSDDPMPFLLGGHPAFRCDDLESCSLYFEKPETGEQVLVNKENALLYKKAVFEPLAGKMVWPVDRTYLASVDTLMLPNLNSRSVKLANEKTGKGIKFSFPDFPVLAIWTKPNVKGKYLCLEPWQGLPSWEDEICELKNRPFALTLEPGKTYHAAYQMDCLV
jgi:Galactose mutarotase and related enzymes